MVKLYDVIESISNKQVNVLDKGFVRIVDVMPRLVPEGATADYAIAEAARVSYAGGTTRVSDDENLIRYLLRRDHTSPFEQCELKFHIKINLFALKQMIRHRTANVNEQSARYSVMKEEFYIPACNNVRLQSTTNKQGGSDIAPEAVANNFIYDVEDLCKDAYQKYEDAIEKGISREQARMLLPQNLYTELYWKCDLHNIMHFLRLRMDSHAQQEIRVYAEAIAYFVKSIFPISYKAFEDYKLNAITLTAIEIEAIKTGKFNSTNKREVSEWTAKLKLTGLDQFGLEKFGCQ